MFEGMHTLEECKCKFSMPLSTNAVGVEIIFLPSSGGKKKKKKSENISSQAGMAGNAS